MRRITEHHKLIMRSLYSTVIRRDVIQANIIFRDAMLQSREHTKSFWTPNPKAVLKLNIHANTFDITPLCSLSQCCCYSWLQLTIADGMSEEEGNTYTACL